MSNKRQMFNIHNDNNNLPWIPEVRHALALMHVGIAYPRWRGKRSRHPRFMRNPQFEVSGKRLMLFIEPNDVNLLHTLVIVNHPSRIMLHNVRVLSHVCVPGVVWDQPRHQYNKENTLNKIHTI